MEVITTQQGYANLGRQGDHEHFSTFSHKFWQGRQWEQRCNKNNPKNCQITQLKPQLQNISRIEKTSKNMESNTK